MKALVTGATGTIGRALEARLDGDTVVLSRDPEAARHALPRATALGWNGVDDLPAGALDGVEAVFHLAGEPVAEGRWTEAKRAQFLDVVIDTLAEHAPDIKSLILHKHINTPHDLEQTFALSGGHIFHG